MNGFAFTILPRGGLAKQVQNSITHRHSGTRGSFFAIVRALFF